jgi:hypothetical protein
MSNETSNSNDKKVYDLEERTARLGESVIDFVKTLPRNLINNELIGQIIRSATSTGAIQINKRIVRNYLTKLKN